MTTIAQQETPSQIVWRAHGAPVVAGCSGVESRCYVCAGITPRGKQVSDAIGDNFTGQTLVRNPAGSHVCEACCYVMSRASPVLGRDAKEGKKFGGNFRNYSSMWDERGYLNASKGEKPLIREFLARDHAGLWFAALADSGQKHVLPYAPMNGPGRSGLVLFDEQPIDVPDDQTLVAVMTDLLTAGITKDELSDGDYRVATMREMADAAMAFEAAHGAERGSGWFTLALWLAQRDEEKSAERLREKEARDVARRDAARPAKRVPVRAGRKAAAKLLGDVPVADASSGAHDDERERMGDAGPAQASDPDDPQLRLEGLG